MTNEEKAQELSEKHSRYNVPCSSLECYLSALEMASWKEQQMINKAAEWIKANITYVHPRKGTEECVVNLNRFIEEMKGE